MSRLTPRSGAMLRPLARLAFAMLIASLVVFVTLAAIKAIRSPWLVDDFPESLAIKAELMPVIFPVHMIAGGLALLLVPLAAVLNPYARWHRPLARVAAIDVLVAGVTAFPVALIAPVTTASALGFTAQGLLWLALLALGIRSIRRGETERHRAFMLLMAAATSGALFFRIFLALWAIWGSPRDFEAFYALDAWIAWLLPVSLMALWLQQNTLRRAKP